MDEIDTSFPSEFNIPVEDDYDDDNIPEIDTPKKTGNVMDMEDETSELDIM